MELIMAIIGTIGLGLLALHEHGAHKEWMERATQQEKLLDDFIAEHGLKVPEVKNHVR